MDMAVCIEAEMCLWKRCGNGKWAWHWKWKENGNDQAMIESESKNGRRNRRGEMRTKLEPGKRIEA